MTTVATLPNSLLYTNGSDKGTVSEGEEDPITSYMMYKIGKYNLMNNLICKSSDDQT